MNERSKEAWRFCRVGTPRVERLSFSRAPFAPLCPPPLCPSLPLFAPPPLYRAILAVFLLQELLILISRLARLLSSNLSVSSVLLETGQAIHPRMHEMTMTMTPTARRCNVHTVNALCSFIRLIG